MNKECPHCGQQMQTKNYKVTAGYYSKLQNYIVEADNENEARDKVRDIVQKSVHPEADVVGIKEV